MIQPLNTDLSSFGTEAYILTGYFNLPKILGGRSSTIWPLPGLSGSVPRPIRGGSFRPIIQCGPMRAPQKLVEQAKRIARPSEGKRPLDEIRLYNSMVLGIQNYFHITASDAGQGEMYLRF